MSAMKKTLTIILLIAASCVAKSQTTTPPDSLPHRYYTPEWYADCPAFQSDTNDYTLLLNFIYGAPNPYENDKYYANEYYIDGQMEIKGLMCLVEAEFPLGQYVITQPERAPEWLTLMQGGALYPATGLIFPREVTFVDSLRWDTAQPFMVRLPRFDGAVADSDHFLFYVYEVYFPTPIVVDSVFYVAGSVHSNTYVRERPEPGVEYYVLDHYPTVYGAIAPVIRLDGTGICDFCTTRNNRMFTADGGLHQNREDWYTMWHCYSHHHDRFRQITGPMFAICDFHTLTLNSSDPDAGSVSGAGDYPHLSTATAVANPEPGHSFVRWSDGSTDNPRTMQMLNDVRLVAVFR